MKKYKIIGLIYLLIITILIIAYFISLIVFFQLLFISIVPLLILGIYTSKNRVAFPFYKLITGEYDKEAKMSCAKAERIVKRIQDPFMKLEDKWGFLTERLKEKDLKKIGSSFQSYSNREIDVDDFLSFSLKTLGTKFSKIF